MWNPVGSTFKIYTDHFSPTFIATIQVQAVMFHLDIVFAFHWFAAFYPSFTLKLLVILKSFLCSKHCCPISLRIKTKA